MLFFTKGVQCCVPSAAAVHYGYITVDRNAEKKAVLLVQQMTTSYLRVLRQFLLLLCNISKALNRTQWPVLTKYIQTKGTIYMQQNLCVFEPDKWFNVWLC